MLMIYFVLMKDNFFPVYCAPSLTSRNHECLQQALAPNPSQFPIITIHRKYYLRNYSITFSKMLMEHGYLLIFVSVVLLSGHVSNISFEITLRDQTHFSLYVTSIRHLPFKLKVYNFSIMVAISYRFA